MKKKYNRTISWLLLSAILVSVLGAGCASKEDPPKVSVTELPSSAAPETSLEETATTAETTLIPVTSSIPVPPSASDKPEETTRPEPPKEPVPSGGKTFYVRVNCQTNTVNIFKRDADGAYSIPYHVMVCSSGLDESPTPTGTYHLTGRRWQWLELLGSVWGMYTTQIKGNYLFHSVPFTEKGNHGSLQEGEYDKLGQDASHGCIRLRVADARWIYENMKEIEAVEIYNSPDPGPMGKPTAQKIGNSAYPGWDPTDQDENNPWLKPEVPAPSESRPAEPAESTPAESSAPVASSSEPESTPPVSSIPADIPPEASESTAPSDPENSAAGSEPSSAPPEST